MTPVTVTVAGGSVLQPKKKFGFTMEASLAAAKRAPLLRGVTVAFTPTVAKGKVGEMLARVVPHAGGVVLPKLPTATQVRVENGKPVPRHRVSPPQLLTPLGARIQPWRPKYVSIQLRT